MRRPVRWKDDPSVPADHRDLLKKGGRSMPLPMGARGRSAARVHRLLVVPAAAGLLLWMKSVAAAGLCVLGVVAAVRAVPPLTRLLAPIAGRAPAESPPTPRLAAPAVVAAPTVDVAIPSAESPPEAPPSPSKRESSAVAVQTALAHSHAARPKVEASPQEVLASGDSLAHEAAMLEQARSLLDRNPAAAMVVVDRHAATFRSPSLGIERELIAVEALRRLGRTSDAQARGTALLEQARGSIYEERVKAMLVTLGSPKM